MARTIFLLLPLILLKIPTQSATYYLSPTGNDEHSGTSPSAAWLSLDKLNQTTFQPEDVILLESDGIWYGNLKLNGSGATGKPITLSSYGKGAMPVINIGEKEGVGIELLNQSWWTIDGIEITSGAPHKLNVRRGGIMAIAEGESGRTEHITIRNCFVHDIWGDVGGDKSGIAIYVGERILGQTKILPMPYQ